VKVPWKLHDLNKFLYLKWLRKSKNSGFSFSGQSIVLVGKELKGSEKNKKSFKHPRYM